MRPITISGFLGANLATDDLQLPEQVGVQSLNQRPGRGDMRPWNQPGATAATVPTSPQRNTIYRMGQDVASEANYWLGWSTIVHAIRGFDTDDPTERTYFTGSGSPKWTNNDIGLSGGPPYPQGTRELSVPAPTTGITVALNTDGPSGDEVAHGFIYTFVNDIGWESAPSPPSNTILAKPGATLDLSGFSAAPTGNYGIALIRLYKLVTDSTGTAEYFFHREWAIGSTPSNPIDDARGLGSDQMATTGWLPLPDNAKGLKVLWNGMLAAIVGKSVRICEPYTPYAWKLAYEIGLTEPGVALGVWGQRLLILTTGDASVAAGSSPDVMDDEPLNINRRCVSERSVVDFNEGEAFKGVAWASDEGLCWYGDGGFRLLTEGVLEREQWQAIVPSTIVAGKHLGLYVGFYHDGVSRKGFVIDPKNPQGIYFLSAGYNAVFRDPLTDRLFVLDGGNVRRWNAGAAMTATFKSRVFATPAPINIGAIEVIAKAYPVTLTLWADGVQVHTQSVPSEEPIRPPGGYEADKFQVQIESAHRVIAVRLAKSVDDLRQG
jgi:hypothetical protein